MQNIPYKNVTEWMRTLGIPLGANATERTIQAAFKQLALKTHPNKVGGNSGPFLRVHEARNGLLQWLKAQRQAMNAFETTRRPNVKAQEEAARRGVVYRAAVEGIELIDDYKKKGLNMTIIVSMTSPEKGYEQFYITPDSVTEMRGNRVGRSSPGIVDKIINQILVPGTKARITLWGYPGQSLGGNGLELTRANVSMGNVRAMIDTELRRPEEMEVKYIAAMRGIELIDFYKKKGLNMSLCVSIGNQLRSQTLWIRNDTNKKVEEIDRILRTVPNAGVKSVSLWGYPGHSRAQGGFQLNTFNSTRIAKEMINKRLQISPVKQPKKSVSWRTNALYERGVPRPIARPRETSPRPPAARPPVATPPGSRKSLWSWVTRR